MTAWIKRLAYGCWDQCLCLNNEKLTDGQADAARSFIRHSRNQTDMPNENPSLNWLVRTILLKYGCLFSLGIMAACVSLISIGVLRSCGFSEEKAHAMSSDLGDKAAFVLVVLVLTTGSAYWIWRGFVILRNRKLPPPLPAPPLPVPVRPRPIIQEAVSLVAPPSSGNHSVLGTIHDERWRGPELMPENNEPG